MENVHAGARSAFQAWVQAAKRDMASCQIGMRILQLPTVYHPLEFSLRAATIAVIVALNMRESEGEEEARRETAEEAGGQGRRFLSLIYFLRPWAVQVLTSTEPTNKYRADTTRHQIRPPVKRPPGALGSKRTALAAVLLSSWLHRTTPNTPKRAPQPPPPFSRTRDHFPQKQIITDPIRPAIQNGAATSRPQGGNVRPETLEARQGGSGAVDVCLCCRSPEESMSLACTIVLPLARVFLGWSESWPARPTSRTRLGFCLACHRHRNEGSGSRSHPLPTGLKGMLRACPLHDPRTQAAVYRGLLSFARTLLAGPWGLSRWLQNTTAARPGIFLRDDGHLGPICVDRAEEPANRAHGQFQPRRARITRTARDSTKPPTDLVYETKQALRSTAPRPFRIRPLCVRCPLDQSISSIMALHQLRQKKMNPRHYARNASQGLLVPFDIEASLKSAASQGATQYVRPAETQHDGYRPDTTITTHDTQP